MSTAVLHNSPDPTHITREDLSPVQVQVVAELAQGRSVSAAARQAGVHRSTIHHWLRHTSEFKAAVQSARREYSELISDQLRELASSALDTLRKLLDDPDTPAIIRMRTALAILERPHSPDSDWRLPGAGDPSRPGRFAEFEAELRAIRASS